MNRPLDPELDLALMRELLSTYENLNDVHFRDQLQTPGLALVDAVSFWARWVPGTRRIEVTRRLVHEQPWTVVVEVLKHEMAHQYVHEVLREDEAPHGPAFRRVCERLGIDARSAGLPHAREVSSETERVIERVQKLLALAQSDNPHEAESATAAAQKLMLKHNLGEQNQGSAPRYSFRQIGRITGRTQSWERRLANLLSTHFFVDVIWVPAFRPEDGKRGNVLEAIGTEANLSLAAYVHDFVARAAEQMWQRHKRTEGIRKNRDRLAYLAGVITGFSEKLAAQQQRHRQEGLVWVPEAARERYVRKRHPYLRTMRRQGQRPSAAFGEGRKAGQELVLHRGMERGASQGTRLLPG